MALTKKYGLSNSRYGIVEKGWSSLPTFYAYVTCNSVTGSIYFSAYCYVEKVGSSSSSYYRTRDVSGSGTGCYKYVDPTFDKITSLYSYVLGKSKDWFRLKSEFENVKPTRQLVLGEQVRTCSSTEGFDSDFYTVVEYYKITITLSIAGNNTGTIALYNGSTLLKSGAGDYTYVGTSIPTFKVKYTTASQNATWHNANFFNGMRLDGVVQSASFGYGTAEFSFQPTSNSHACSVNIGSRKTITFVGRSGVESYSASFSRTYSTGNFTKTSSGTQLAPKSVSGSTNTTYLRFESGNISVSAKASAGSVFTSAGGFVCSDVAALNLHGDGSDSISGSFVTPTKGGTVNIVPTSYNIKIAMPSGYSAWGSVKIIDNAGNEGIELSIVSGRIYTFVFTSARENYEQPSVNVWKKDGVSLGSGVSSWTAPAILSGAVNIEPELVQNAWPVSVSAGSNGSAAWLHRYNISPLVEISNTGYLRKDKSDYGVVSVSPSDQYVIATRTLTGVEAYSSGGAQAFRLFRDASHTVHSIAYTFALAECVVQVQLPTEFADKVEVGIGASSATTARLYFYGYDSATEWETATSYAVGAWVNVTNGSDVAAYRCAVAHTSGTFEKDLSAGKWTPMYVTVMCRIKSDFYDQYRVADWTIGGVSGLAGETMVSGRSYYYIVTPSNVAGRLTLVCRPRVVSTVNPLTVTKTNLGSGTIDYNKFAVVNIKKGASGTWQTISSATWMDNISENTEVTITANPLFGGKIGLISHTGFTPLEEDGNMIRFNMPGAEANVSIQIGEQGKVTLVVDLSNLTSTTPVVGKVTLTSPASSSVHVDITPSSIRPVSVNVYRETNYTLTAEDTDVVYGFADWYKNGSVDPTPSGGSDLVRNINLTDNSTTYVAAYAIRQTYDISINYGTRSGSDVKPETLPSSGVFGCVITTPRDGAGGWVMNRVVEFKVGDWPDDPGIGTVIRDGEIYKWTPESVQIKYGENAYETIWTYDATRPNVLTGSFRIRGDMTVRMIYVEEHLVGYAMVKARLMGGVIPSMGQLGIYSVGMTGYSAVASTASAACMTLKRAVFTASPNPGYAFGGWFKLESGSYVQVVTTEGVKVNGTVLEVESLTSAGATYYASFVASSAHLKIWNDGQIAKTFDWRSKVYVGSQFFAMRCVRVYSDSYPVTLELLTATSPNDCINTDASRKLTLAIQSQRPILIPTMRLEKYFAFRVTGNARINHVGIGTSMEALK